MVIFIQVLPHCGKGNIWTRKYSRKDKTQKIPIFIWIYSESKTRRVKKGNEYYIHKYKKEEENPSE